MNIKIKCVLVLFIASCTCDLSAAVPVNGTEDQVERLNLTRTSRQEDVGDVAEAGANIANGAGAAAGAAQGAAAGTGGAGYLTQTYANVGQILNGVFDGDITPVLAGGAAFIPSGELRQSVSQLLIRSVAPQVNQLIRDVGNSIQQRLNGTTPPPTTFSQNPNQYQHQTFPVGPSHSDFGRFPDVSNPVPSQVSPNSAAVGGGPSPTEVPTKSVINIPNPLEALQKTFQSSQSGGGSSPLESIRNRLQSLLPINIFGGGSSSSTGSSESNKNIAPAPINQNPVNSNAILISNSNSNINNNNNNNNNNNINRYRQGIPASPLVV